MIKLKNNMTHRTRNVLFIILFILFLITAPIVVFYSLGWRFNWETKRIVQTGVFYFRVWPKNAQLYIDGDFKDKTDFFFNSISVSDLLSGKYKIEIKKGDYYDWRKTLEIKKREITEAKNIVLIPKNPAFNIIAEQVTDFFFSTNERKIILKQEDNKTWSLKLFDLEKNIKSHLIEERDISKQEVEIINLEFSHNSKIVLLELGLKENIQYYILEIEKTPAKLTQLNFLDSVEEIEFHPGNSERLFISQTIKDKKTNEQIKILNEVDITNQEILPTILENIITYSITDNKIYCLDNSGSIFKTNFIGEEKEKLNILPLSIKEETRYEIIILGSQIFLQENNVLYIFNKTQKSFEKFFEPIKDQSLSPDYKKIVYFNDYEIYILFLEKQYDQPEKETNEQLFLTRFSEKIENLFWYTNYYLIFNLGDKIKVIEIDERDKINIYILAQFKNPEIFWANKKLYILSEKKLYSSEELTP